jgi:hypothetical protein
MCLALVWKSNLTLNPDIIYTVLVDAACDAVKTTSRLSEVSHRSWFAPARQTIHHGTCDLGLFPRFVLLRTFSLFSHLLLLSPHTKCLSCSLVIARRRCYQRRALGQP